MADSSRFEEIQWDVLLQDLPQSPKICLDDLGLPLSPHYFDEDPENEKGGAENISSKPPIESMVSELSALNEILFSDDGTEDYTFDANGIDPNEFIDIDSFLADICSSQQQPDQDDQGALEIQPFSNGETSANGGELTEEGVERLGACGRKRKRYSSMENSTLRNEDNTMKNSREEADNVEVVSWSSCSHGGRKTDEPAVLVVDSLQKEFVFCVVMTIMMFLMACKLPLKKRMQTCQEQQPYFSRKNRKTIFISFYIDEGEGERLRKWIWCRERMKLNCVFRDSRDIL